MAFDTLYTCTYVHTHQLLTCLQWDMTPLHCARDAATVQLLLEHGANIHAVDEVRMCTVFCGME